jgi:hypothetical protein
LAGQKWHIRAAASGNVYYFQTFFGDGDFHIGRPLKAQGAGDVAFKAGHANSHVSRIAQFLQHGHQDSNGGSHPDNSLSSRKNVFAWHQHPPHLFFSTSFYPQILCSI